MILSTRQAAFSCERLGMGAFRIALESVFNRIHLKPLEYTSFGKPNPFVFQSAGAILRNLQLSRQSNDLSGDKDAIRAFRTLYMIDDNPFVDVKGAQQAGHPGF
ncbi:mitochondrial hydrolase YKR070W-like isoform X2 [Nicotiana tomentosiformis]|uniref:mitochondrial hydrolase YKR070W-like isoform X2 n=1 Tax=Nicotiana tomentosiformis TaxID=4098 RepID=UPI00388C560A